VPHFTYDQGALEISRPGLERLRIDHALSSTVDLVAEVCEIDFEPIGSTTYHRRSAARGFEPDAGYYIQHAEQMQSVREVDGETHPPPDLIIVVDATGEAANKLSTYAALGVPEVWQYAPVQVSIHILCDGVYESSMTSAALPMLTSDMLTRFVEQHQTLSSLAWRRMVREWAAQQDQVDRAGS
jgi:Uma2 family endonuclease